jgi:hypothetical protein
MSAKLNPAAHRQFLELLMATSRAALSRNPNGDTVAVIGAYQVQFEAALAKISASVRRKRRPVVAMGRKKAA